MTRMPEDATLWIEFSDGRPFTVEVNIPETTEPDKTVSRSVYFSRAGDGVSVDENDLSTQIVNEAIEVLEEHTTIDVVE